MFFLVVRSREKAIFKIKRKLVFDNRRCESHCVRSVFVDKRKEGRKEGKKEVKIYDTSHVGRIKELMSGTT